MAIQTKNSLNLSRKKESSSVLIVGGGVSGVQAALDLTELGFSVTLVEKSGAIGGIMALLDKTFPTNDCSLCILAPKLVEAGRNPNIKILTNTKLVDLKGVAGNFSARLLKKPRYIDENTCSGCGQCSIYCPSIIGDRYNECLSITKAAHIDYAQAVPTSYYIDPNACFYLNYKLCNICSTVCPTKAIHFDQKDTEIVLNVGTVILAPGVGRMPRDILERFGWGRYEDIVTSYEFERLMCASGPTGGEIVRPSDSKHPKTIAFIQCIGSRDNSCFHNYCSSVCCMYAIKEATMAKEHDPELKVTLFMMDVRTHGKGFDEARIRATREKKLKIIRARPNKITKVEDKFLITYVDENNNPCASLFDMIVLSVGLNAPDNAEELARACNISLNKYNFADTSLYAPLETSRPGVFVIGAFQGPKDIPDSVTQASAASALSSSILKQRRHKEIVHIKYPPEQDISKEEPRIGVFICHCGINIGGVVNVEAVRDYAAKLPFVVYATDNMYSCSQDAQKRIIEKIKEHKLNRIVVAACTPRTHEPLFQATLREAGLNRSLFEMANIRDQCSWVHMHQPHAATQKAKDLVRMAVAKAIFLSPLKEREIKVIPSALVIGGGISGMNAALFIAEQGYKVTLVEREEQLGGQALKITSDRLGNDPRKYVKSLIKKITNHPLITVYTKSNIVDVNGYIGNFTSKIESINTQNNSIIRIEHGVIIIATGGKQYIPNEYLYGQSKQVITQLDLENILDKNQEVIKKLNTLVMIQCVGSRGQNLSYCSRVCCIQAIKNALRIKDINPKASIYILYRDIRTYGFSEDDYRLARQKGITFIRYKKEQYPKVVKENNAISLYIKDSILKDTIKISPDLLVLSVGIVPSDVKDLARILKVPLTKDGFFLEAHVKLRPVDLAVDGIYVCGLAHSPKTIDEAISQAQAAAARACQPLSKGKIIPEPIVSNVNQEKCIGCGVCVEFCPYKAIQMVKVGKRKKAQTIAASCKGCGICAARCPALAIDMGRFTYQAITAQIKAFQTEDIKKEKLEI